MPSKRTNDSVDEILQELDRQQTARDVHSSLTDRQVDDILRSMGMEEPAHAADTAGLGPIELGDLPSVELGAGPLPDAAERFSTQVLDDLLGDLPSLHTAAQQPAAPMRPAAQPQQQPAAPRRPAQQTPAARQATPAQQPQQKTAAPARPAAQPQQQPAAPQRPAQQAPAAHQAAPAQQPQQKTAAPARPAAQPQQQPAAPKRPAQQAPAARQAAPAQPQQQPATPARSAAQPQQQPAAPQRPVQQAPAARQAAPAQQTQQKPAAPARPAAQPQQQPAAPQRPAVSDTTTGLGDTTRTGIIKNFLRKMAPGAEDADQTALDAGKQEFQRFFAKSAAVVPDEKGRLHAPAKKKHGLFGLGSVEDTDEFVPINVSLTGSHTEQPPADRTIPGLEELYPEEEAAPAARPKKKGLFARLLGGREEAADELYIPEGREAEPAPPTHRGVVLEDTADDIPVPADQLSMQLPVENIRSRYTAGPGNGLDMPPALNVSAEEQAMWPSQDTAAYDAAELYAGLGLEPEPTDSTAPTGELALGDLPVASVTDEPDILAGILPGTSTLEFLQQQMAAAAPAPAAPAAPAPTGNTVYRKKRPTVEFVPRQGSPAAPQKPYRAPGPVGEPVMQTEAPAAPAPPPAAPAAPAEAAPVQAAPEAVPPVEEPSTGFTMQIDAPVASEDTQFFLDAYGQARKLHEAPGAAPATGEVALGGPAAAAPTTSQFVRNIEESINADAGETDTAVRFAQAAQILTDTTGEQDAVTPPAPPLRLDGVPADERTGTVTSPFVAAPHVAQHSYDKPEDAPAVRRDLDRQALVLAVSTIITGVAALVLIYLGVAAFGTGAALPAPLSLAGGKQPLLITMLVLLVLACGLCWRTLLWGLKGLVRTPSPDSMPALAAIGALVQLVVFLIWPDLYDPSRFCLVAGSAALLLCANTAGKALDAHTLRAGFGLVSAKTEHAVARRLVESGLLQAATRGLGEPRPCVLISRPTELFKGFLTNANARRPSDKNQQQFARGLLICAALSVAFTLIYHRDSGKAVTALAAVFCLGAPLASTLLSALPAHLMQRSAAQVGAVIPGWHDIRQLGRINVIHLTARDLFPEGSVRLCGIKPVHKEHIDRAIIYAASVLAHGSQNMQDVFLGMIGDNRKLLAKVDDLETVYGKGYIGWIDGERVLVGNRRLMEDHNIKIPSWDYEQRHTVNQRRFVYLAVSGKLYSVFQLAYQRDPDTAAVLENLRRTGISLVVDCDDFNCDAPLLEAVYTLPTGTVKVLTAEERETLAPATAWLPESSGNMLHLGSFASFIGGLEAAAGAAEGERRASMVLSASVLLSAVLAIVLSVPKGGITALSPLALVLYQVAWCVLALIFPILQRY